MNSCLVLWEPIARRGFEGRPDGRLRTDEGSNGSTLSSDICAAGPGSRFKNRSLVCSTGLDSSGEGCGGSDRRFSGKVHIRHADVNMKMLYVR